MEETMELAVINADYTPAVITADWEGMTAKLEKLIEPYKGLTPEIVAGMDQKEAKRCRTDLKRMSTDLNNARKAVKREFNKPLAAFEAKCKELDALILEPWGVLDGAIKLAEENDKAARREALEQQYYEFAPALADVVPFEQLLEKEWLNKSYGEVKATDALLEKVTSIAKDWKTLKATALQFPQETEAEFFRSLSLRSALDYDARRVQEQERIETMRAEVEANRSGKAMAVVDVTPDLAVDPKSLRFEPIHVHLIAVEATDAQRDKFIEFMKAEGMHGKVISTYFTDADEALKAVRSDVCYGKRACRDLRG